MSKPERSPITTHILDTHLGKPASGVKVLLEKQVDSSVWKALATALTNSDGRIEDLLPRGSKADAGIYRLTFETRPYFRQLGITTFYPQVSIVFDLDRPEQHYHVPLLLSGHGFSTYRGT